MKRNIKLIFLLFLILDFMLFCALLFKGPKTDASLGVAMNEDYKKVKIENDKIYSQKFRSELNDLHEVSFLTLRSNEKLEGILNVKIFDDNDKLISETNFNADQILNKNLMKFGLEWTYESQGKYYRMDICASDLSGNAYFAIIDEKNAEKFLIDGEKQKETLVYYYTGTKRNKTYLWYPVMIAAVGFVLFVVLNGEVRNGKK